MNPGYARWFEKRSRVDDAPEPDLRRPIKRPHVQAFNDKIQERLVWGEKEKGYKATIHALKESLRNLNLEKDLQAQEAEGENKSLTCENKNLHAQFQKMKKDSEAPMRSWKDQKIITNLLEKMQDYDPILANTEKALGKAKERIIQLNEEAKSNKERQVMRSEEDMAQFKKEKDRLIHSEAQLHAQLEEARRYNREHQHADIDIERAQARLDQARLRAQLESALDREDRIRDIATTRQQQLQNQDQRLQDFRARIHDLAVYTSQSYVNCQGMDYGRFVSSFKTIFL
ncbi:uncharacterized protein [Nicotiana sylvestris]|uniref:uncharacterized protein n=1 Tax=Nicotiana sylvestris TaxID=4096 RepID=UPI00388C8C57